MKNTRRDFFKKSAALVAGGMAAGMMPSISKAENLFLEDQPGFVLPPLPYSYDALEPHIDKMTMEIHHSKHHQAYVNNLNKALGTTGSKLSIEEICKTISKHPVAIRNNGGGHYNHSLFWTLMKPNAVPNNILGDITTVRNEPTGAIAEALAKSFNSVEEFKTKFSDVAKKHFGSGWAWLVVNADKKLQMGSLPNQDNPLMDLPAGQAGVSELKGPPVLALDIWEHAYYLQHQNLRADYISAWWNVVNWDKVNELYAAAMR